MDLTKLTPEPWEAVRQADLRTLQPTGTFVLAHGNLDIAEFRKPSPGEAETNADFTALARKAFGVMMRRGWGTEAVTTSEREPIVWRFTVVKHNGEPASDRVFFDPFTALVEVDQWYTDNIDNMVPHLGKVN